MRLRATLPLSLLLVCACVAVAQTGPRTPAQGSAERKAVLDALRIPVEKELGRKVVFKVDHLKVSGSWAFVRGVPQQPGGRPMDYRGTPYQEAIDDGVFDDWVCALLRHERDRWRVVEFVIGATDVPYEGWDRKHKAPSAIFR